MGWAGVMGVGRRVKGGGGRVRKKEIGAEKATVGKLGLGWFRAVAVGLRV